MKKQIENEAIKLFNECCKLGLCSSYRSVLETMYETAIDNKNYHKANIILVLISEDIKS